MMGLNRHHFFWLSLFGITLMLSSFSFQLYKAFDARWIIRFPKKYELPTEKWISVFLDWLVDSANFYFFTFRDVTRSIASLIEWPYQFLRNLLIEGFQSGLGDQAVQYAPSLSWIAVITVVVAISYYASDWRLGALTGACFAYLAVFGQWQSATVSYTHLTLPTSVTV